MSRRAEPRKRPGHSPLRETGRLRGSARRVRIMPISPGPTPFPGKEHPAMTNDRARRLHALFTPVVHSCGHNRWCPAADVYRTADGWLVKVELAGVRPE